VDLSFRSYLFRTRLETRRSARLPPCPGAVTGPTPATPRCGARLGEVAGEGWVTRATERVVATTVAPKRRTSWISAVPTQKVPRQWRWRCHHWDQRLPGNGCVGDAGAGTDHRRPDRQERHPLPHYESPMSGAVSRRRRPRSRHRASPAA